VERAWLFSIVVKAADVVDFARCAARILASAHAPPEQLPNPREKGAAGGCPRDGRLVGSPGAISMRTSGIGKERMMTSRQSTDGSVIDRLSKYMVEARTARLPEEVARKAKHHILDTIAAMVSGATLEPGKVILDYLQKQGGTEEAQVIGTSMVTTAVNAALANGVLAHADETDDSHAPSLTHPGCAIIPAALAMAERENSTGEALLRAVVLGYDTGPRVNRALGPRSLSSRGRSTHATGGVFGAAAAAGSLANLNAEQLRYMFSYAAQHAAGINAFFTAADHVEKAYVFGGLPAHNGVLAAEFAQAGFIGALDVFQGASNFLEAFSEEPNPQELVAELGSRYEIMLTNIKKFCVGSPIQAAADALLMIINQHGMTVDDVDRLVVKLTEWSFQVVNERHMPDINLQYMLAVTLLDGDLTFAAAHDFDRMRDPKVLEVKSRIRFEADESLVTPESPRQAIVEITAKDGRHFREHVVKVRGTTENPMTTEEVVKKAHELLVLGVGEGKADQLIDAVINLESLASVRELRPLLQP